MDFRPLAKTEQENLFRALRGNADERNGILIGRDTGFCDISPWEAEEASDTEVIEAIRSVPVHY